jgi:predicted RNA-binding Zn ribbon-like protein
MRSDPLEFRFHGGAHWLDLVATTRHTHGPAPVDRLTDAGRFAEWLAATNLTPAGPPPTEHDLDRARELRAALRRLAHARVDGVAPDEADVALVNGWAARAESRGELAGGWRQAPAATVDEVLGRLAQQAIDQLTGREAEFLGVCDSDECRMPFLDTTGRRRWCDPVYCGTRERVRAHRARKRAGS